MLACFLHRPTTSLGVDHERASETHRSSHCLTQMAKTADAWREMRDKLSHAQSEMAEMKGQLTERTNEVARLKEREVLLTQSLREQSDKLEGLNRKLELSEVERKLALVHAP